MRDADALEQAYTEAGLDTIGAMMDTDNPELVSLMYMINTGEVDATAMLNHIYQQLIDQYSPPYQGDPTDRSNSEIASDAWRTKQLSW